jgi:DNA-directed RNA polymerase specialized sigma24 family protein
VSTGVDSAPDTGAADPKQERIASHLAELDAIKQALSGVPRLYDRRLELYQLLRADGVPYRTIAEHTDSGVEAVRVAISKARNG